MSTGVIQHYILRNGDAQRGPFDRSEINAMRANRELADTDLIWIEGSEDWKPVAWLDPQPPALPSSVPPPLPDLVNAQFLAQQDLANRLLLFQSKKKSGGVAAILSFFLPGLGYLYADMFAAGLFMMFLWGGSLVFFPFTIPVTTLLWLIGIIDGFLAVGRYNRRIAAKMAIPII